MKTFLIITIFLLSFSMAKADTSANSCNLVALNFDGLSHAEAVKLAEEPLEFLHKQRMQWIIESFTKKSSMDNNEAHLKALQCLNLSITIRIELAEILKKETETKNP